MIEELAPGVVVVGTAHISAASVAEVESTIRARKPKKVLVELDARRLQALQDPDAWRKTDIIQVIKENKQHLFLLQLYLAAMQARMGRETGVAPGSELLKAVEVAKEVGAEVVLIDRDVGMTLRRAFDGLGLQQKASLALNVLLEMMPGAKADDEQPAARRGWSQAAIPAGALALVAFFAPLRERLMSGIERFLDAVVGYPSVPATTVVLLGLAIGTWLAAMIPLRGERRSASESVSALAWSGLIGGFLAAWAWSFTNGLAPDFLGRLLPGPTPASLGLAAALAWFGLGSWMAYRFTRMVRRVLAQRARMQAGPLDIDALLEQDAITQMTEEFARFAPSIKHVLIDERDTYMASHILEQSHAAPQAADGSGGIVAIVGAGHLAGIKAQAKSAGPQVRAALDEAPPKRFTVGKALAWAVPLALVGAFVYLGWRGVQEGNFQDLLQSLGWFALITSTCAALGAAIALGHPYSIAAAFLAAPIATLHPLIASGWFAGIVEAKVRTPTVADFEAIKTLQTVGQFWRNGVVRILMVTAITNVGAMIGFWIATGRVLQILGGGA